MTLQIFWPKPGNPREGGQKGGTNGGSGGEGGSRAKPGNQLVTYMIQYVTHIIPIVMSVHVTSFKCTTYRNLIVPGLINYVCTID